MSISSSSSSLQLESHSSSGSTKAPLLGKKIRRAFKHLDKIEWAIRVFAVISVILLVTTIVLLGLAMAEYVHPLLALYTFSGSIGAFIVIQAIDCCQQSIAKKNKFDLQEHYYPVKQRPTKPKPPAKNSV